MGTLWQDLRYAARIFGRSPAFTAIATLILALGIGANAAIFSVVHAVLLRPLPFPDPNRIVFLWETDYNRDIERGTASLAEFLDWREQAKVFQDLSAWRSWFYSLTGAGEPEQVWGVLASANFFHLLGVQPALGRSFLPEEETPGRDQVAILSHALWERRFGGDPRLVGQTILIDDKPYTVVGILPAGFSLFGTSRQYDLWMPLAYERTQLRRDDHTVIVFGRIKPEYTIAQAQAEMATIMHRLHQEYPNVDQGVGIRIVTMHDDIVATRRPVLLILSAAVAFVLLIACANVANMLLARAADREREIAVRTSLGASRLRLVRQLITESVLLALVGGALGLLFAYGGLHLLLAAIPASGSFGELPRREWIRVDGAVFGFSLGVSLLTGILFGLAPALRLPRTNLTEALKEGGRSATGSLRRYRLRGLLVIAETALSLVLLIGAGLLIRSFVGLLREDLGFNPRNLLTMQVWLPENHYTNGAPVASFYEQVLERVRSLPGVVSASAVNFLPLTGWTDYCDLDIEGRPTPPSGRRFTAQYRVVDADYLKTMGIAVRTGRDLTAADGEQAPGVVLINETLARRYWPNEDPVGKRIKIEFAPGKAPWRPEMQNSWVTIVGITNDIKEGQWGQSKVGQVFLPYLQSPSRIMRLVIRTAGNPRQEVSAVRHAVFAVDKNQPVTEVETLEEHLASTLAQRRVSMYLLAFFAVLATALAAVGVYGVMSYAVTQRTHEIGIRMALGAQPRDVLRLIVREGMILALAGILLGLAAAFPLTRALASQLYGVKTDDAATFAGVTLLMVVVALAACYIPARRATRVDPMVALRYE